MLLLVSAIVILLTVKTQWWFFWRRMEPVVTLVKISLDKLDFSDHLSFFHPLWSGIVLSKLPNPFSKDCQIFQQLSNVFWVTFSFSWENTNGLCRELKLDAIELFLQIQHLTLRVHQLQQWEHWKLLVQVLSVKTYLAFAEGSPYIHLLRFRSWHLFWFLDRVFGWDTISKEYHSLSFIPSGSLLNTKAHALVHVTKC